MNWSEFSESRIGDMNWESDHKAGKNIFCYLPNNHYLAFKMFYKGAQTANIEFGILSEYQTGYEKEQHIRMVVRVKEALAPFVENNVLSYGDDSFVIGFDKQDTYFVIKPPKQGRYNRRYNFNEIEQAFAEFQERLEKSGLKAKLMEICR